MIEVLDLVKIEISTESKFGEKYVFLTEELFNILYSDENNIINITSLGYNIPTELDIYLDDLEVFINESYLRVLHVHDIYCIVRNIDMKVIVVPKELLIKL